MDAREWLGLQPTHNPMRWVLPVTPGISTVGSFLFGGCGLGAAIAAIEHASRRPVIWATAQYLSYARTPAILDIDVTLSASGRHVTQARVVGHVADTEILTVNAALGTRDLDVDGIWVTAPEVPPPDRCPARPPRVPGAESVMSRLDVRLAAARPWDDIEGHPAPGGRSALWARVPDLLDLSSGASLAILGDYVPFGISQAIGRPGGGNSLDNTLRVYRLVPTEWVLLDIRIHAVAHGFGHGVVHLWAEDGSLLATASQSTMVRLLRADLAAATRERATAVDRPGGPGVTTSRARSSGVTASPARGTGRDNIAGPGLAV
jgi:acyl-CoA thioesterase